MGPIFLETHPNRPIYKGDMLLDKWVPRLVLLDYIATDQIIIGGICYSPSDPEIDKRYAPLN